MFVPMNSAKKLKVAILDLYEGEPNQGMRCLRSILGDFAQENNINVDSNEFDVRVLNQFPT
jgi:hypothetical protein